VQVVAFEKRKEEMKETNHALFFWRKMKME